MFIYLAAVFHPCVYILCIILGAMQVAVPKKRKSRHTSHNFDGCKEEVSPSGDFLQETDQSGVKHVSPLFDRCVNFIADKLYLVESFVDFPDVVGLKIFQAAKSKDTFYSFANAMHVRSMKLFCDAYETDVLSELNAAGKSCINRNLLSALCIFEHLTKLDLSGCSLGSDDKVVTSISSFTK